MNLHLYRLCPFPGGDGVYFTNPNQIQKFSVNLETIKTLQDTAGKLFQVALKLLIRKVYILEY